MGDSPSFPPASWLGRGLNMTAISPCDITAVTQSVLHNVRLLKVPPGGEERKYPGGVVWKVPEGVNVSPDVNAGKSTTITYETGSRASSALQGDANLAATYLAISGGTSIGYSINKTFQAYFQYCLFNFSQNQLQVYFDDNSSQLQEQLLAKYVKRLSNFATNDDVIAEYRTFFGIIGTHIITGASYGSRAQLTVWASNSDKEVAQNFNVHVRAAFQGLTASGQFDVNVKKSKHYATFERSMQKICSCMGGDAGLASAISSDPTNEKVYEHYKTWVESALRSPAVMNVQTIAIWDLVGLADDPEVYKRSNDISKAYKYIVEHPQDHITKCRFVINSDWGEFGLLTPSASIEPDPNNKPDPDNLVMSQTKILWGREHSHEYERDKTIDFIIRNDGSPVDVALSHGSSGSTSNSGQCMVTINKNPYENKGVKDNNWNTLWFWQCETNPSESAKFPDLVST